MTSQTTVPLKSSRRERQSRTPRGLPSPTIANWATRESGSCSRQACKEIADCIRDVPIKTSEFGSLPHARSKCHLQSSVVSFTLGAWPFDRQNLSSCASPRAKTATVSRPIRSHLRSNTPGIAFPHLRSPGFAVAIESAPLGTRHSEENRRTNQSLRGGKGPSYGGLLPPARPQLRLPARKARWGRSTN